MRVGLVRNVALGMVALVGLGLAGCDDNPTDFDSDETVRITTNPTVLTLPAGVTTLLSSRTENAGNEPTWEEISATVDASCGAGGVAIDVAATYEPSIQPPGQFDVTGGTTMGETCIALSGGGANATVEVTVVGDSLEITGAPDSLNLNSSVDLGAVLLSDDGTPVSPFSEATDIVWSSSDDAVLTVDADGVVTAVGLGGATITATWTDFGVSVSESVAIAVNAPTLEIVEAGTTDPPAPTLLFGTSVDLDGDLVNPTDPPAEFGPFDQTDFTWTSSNEASVEVDPATGVATAVGAGEATITATWTGNEAVVGSVDILVTAPAPTLVSLDVTTGPVGTFVTIVGTDMLSLHQVFVDGDAIPVFQDGDPTAVSVSFWMPNPGFAGAGDYDVQVGLEGDLSNALTFTLTSGNGPDEPANDDPGTAPAAPAFPFTFVDFLDAGDVDDFYSFTLAADATVVFDMDWDSGADFDILVTDGAFTAFACTNGATGAQPEQAVCPLTAGNYLLWINNYDAAPGTYILSAEIQ